MYEDEILLDDGTHSDFRSRVEAVVADIPPGKVMSYGQVAAICGSPRAARIVGGIAHYGPSELPWHRIVNKSGGLASGYPGGRSQQKINLELEGTSVSSEYTVDIQHLLWWPNL